MAASDKMTQSSQPARSCASSLSSKLTRKRLLCRPISFLKGFRGINQPFSIYGLVLRFARVGNLSSPDIDR